MQANKYNTQHFYVHHRLHNSFVTFLLQICILCITNNYRLKKMLFISFR